MTEQQLNRLTQLFHAKASVIKKIVLEDSVLKVEYLDWGGNFHSEGFTPLGTVRTYEV